MKLTNLIRDAFVTGVMNDVPSKANNSEAIRKLVVDDMVQRLPASVRKLWDDKANRHWIKTDFNSYGGVSVNYPSPQQYNSWNKPALTPAVQAQVDALYEETTKDQATRNALHAKIKAAAYGCTADSGIVTGHSGQGQNRSRWTGIRGHDPPESPVTFGRNTQYDP